MPAASIPARAPLGPLRSKRLLSLAGDDRLVEHIRRGNEAAFEVAFERHGAGILGFCRHMLGSQEEAEDAVQQTFASAHRDLARNAEREITLKPWLYAIARNRCLSMLRARREEPAELDDVPTAGLAEEVEQRAELREILRDLGDLPEEQRAALLLAEVGDLSHADVAGVLGCEVQRVKALVYRARSGLIQRRDARETPCEEIREQLANLRGGSLRRSELNLHLRDCPGCRLYRERVKEQRQMLAAALPVVPALGLKSSVLAAVGLGGGGGGLGSGGGIGAAFGASGKAGVAGAGASAAGGAGAGGFGAALGGAFGAATVAKVAAVAVIVGGGAVAGKAVVDEVREPDGTAVTPAAADSAARDGDGNESARSDPGTELPGSVRGEEMSGDRRFGAQGAESRSERSRGRALGRAKARTRHAGRGLEQRAAKPLPQNQSRWRAPAEHPTGGRPVEREPVEQKVVTPGPRVRETPVPVEAPAVEPVPVPAPVEQAPKGPLKPPKE